MHRPFLRHLVSTLVLLTLLAPLGCAHTQRAKALPPDPGAHAHAKASVLRHGRLPEGVVPRLYDIALSLDPNAEAFAGHVSIAVELIESTDSIVLHARHLAMQRVAVQGATGRRHAVEFEALPTEDLIRIRVSPPLPAGMATLYFDYSAEWDPTLTGMYRATVDERHYLFTQMEPLAARRVFPCFDEPRFKTPFEINVTVPKDTFVASNSVAVGERDAFDGKKTVVFQPTPPLPTYLIAFIVGPMDVLDGNIAVSPQRPYTVPLRGLTVQGAGKRIRYAMGRMSHLVQDLESYVDLAYPFSKLDIVAVPDFPYSAMENAATLTFRDWLLLMDGPKAAYTQRRTFEMVMAHELTHQWFGNWVTMPWWDDLWLNEAFATWRGMRTAAHTRPGMQFDVELAEGAGRAMTHDGLISARRIREPCITEGDVYNAGDVITYAKGAAVLNMFEQALGKDRFKEGVRAYLRRYTYHTASSHMFLQAMAQGANAPNLPESFTTFLDQPGVPDLTFSWRCQDDTAQLTISQERYRPLGGPPASGLWQMPVCFRVGTLHAPQGRHPICVHLNESSMTTTLHGCPTWLLPNASGAGYFRSKVPLGQMPAVLAALVEGELSPAEWMAALDNFNAAMVSGALAADVALEAVAQGLKQKTPRVARYALYLLQNAYIRFGVPQHDETVQKSLRKMVQPAYSMLKATAKQEQANLKYVATQGVEADATADRLEELALLRHDLTAFMAQFAQDAGTQNSLAHAGAHWLDLAELRTHTAPAPVGLQNSSKVAATLLPDDVDLALTMAAEALGQPFVARMVEVLGAQSDSDIRHHVVAALGQIKVPALAASVRALALDERLRVNERLGMLTGQMNVPELREATWAFIADNLEALRHHLADKDRATLITMGGALCRDDADAELDKLFKPQIDQFVGGVRGLEQAKENNQLCAALLATQGAQARSFFNGTPVSANNGLN